MEGGYFVKRGVGSKPAILGRKIATTFHRGANYFEIQVDVGSSKVAGSIMGLVKSYATSLVIDLAFLIEAQQEDELPERILGAARMHYPAMDPEPV